MKRRYTITGYIAYALFAVGVTVAFFSSSALAQCLLRSGAVFCGFGLLCCLLTVFFHSGAMVGTYTPPMIASQSLATSAPLIRAIPDAHPFGRTTCVQNGNPAVLAKGGIDVSNTHKISNISLLLLNQAIFLFITIALFYFLESQTQVNARLHRVESGYILQQIAAQPLLLGLFPWMLYSILGIGLAYWSVCFGRQSLLWRAVTWEKENKFGYFWHNVLMIVTDIVTIGPFVFVTSFAMIWLCESICSFFEWDSLFLRPIRTTFICSILILFFKKSNKQLVEWMEKYKISVGKTLLIYAIVFGFCIVWVHAFSVWLFSGMDIEIPIENIKSPFVGFFTDENLKIRMTLLIWGWWIIWIPWMASVVARASVGASVLGALLQASIFPLLLFGVVFFQVKPEQLIAIAQTFQMMPVKMLGGLAVLIFMGLAWGKMQTRGEMSKGMMYAIGRTSKRSLNKWMTLVITWLVCYIPGWIMLGWYLMQFMVTLGGLFMTLVIAFFLFGWITSLFASKHKNLLNSELSKKVY